MVKAEDAYNVVDEENKLEFWYHINDLKTSSQPSVFGFDRFHDFDTYWKLDPLPKKYKCGGGCGLMYETPVENMVVCPYPLTESTLVLDGKTLRDLPVDVPLEGKSAPIGCGDLFYLCSKKDRAEHCIRKCGKLLDDGTKCGALYRNCTNIEFDHKGFFNSYHGPGGVKTYPWEGLFNALPGDSHKSVLSAPEAYSRVDWYVASSGVTGRGVLMETDPGDGSSTTAEFTYTFASDASGDYVITGVFVDSNGDETDSSYTVSVSGSTTVATTPVSSVSVPVWSDIPDPYNLTVGDSFYLYLNGYVTGSYVVGNPTTMTKSGGRIPAGLSFNSGVLSGTVTTVESVSVEFEASNSAGSAKSEWIEFKISAAAPVSATPSTPPLAYSATLGAASGSSLTIPVYTSTTLELTSTMPFRTIKWYRRASWESRESLIDTQNFSPAVSTTKYSPFIPDYADDYTIRAEIVSPSGVSFSVSCTVTRE